MSAETSNNNPFRETRVRGRIVPNNAQMRKGAADPLEIAGEMAAAFEDEVETWPEFHRASDTMDEIMARRSRMR